MAISRLEGSLRNPQSSLMYLRRLLLENIGPVASLKITDFLTGEKPKPVVFVGPNGSGKSLVLAHIANFFLSAKAEIYEGAEMEKGKVFKYRSPLYIRTGTQYSHALLDFGSGLELEEWQLTMSRKELEKEMGSPPPHSSWSDIPDSEHSHFRLGKPSPALPQQLRSWMEGHVFLYFPPNRFEQPAWLNQKNLTYTARFEDRTNLQGYTERRGIAWEVLASVKDWLLGVALDHFVNEHAMIPVGLATSAATATVVTQQIMARIPTSGPNSVAIACINSIVSQILKHRDDEQCQISLGSKQARHIGVKFTGPGNRVREIQNLFALSTGETGLLAMFGGLLRDFDMTGKPYKSVDDISGVVVIDEVDLHLHVDMQRHVLPKLLRLFPQVQFVLSSHSPLFLLGMKEEFGVDGFMVVSLPDGERIDVEQFREFERAYEVFRATARFKSDIKQQLADHHEPLLLTEGESDALHLRTAWEKLFPGILMPFRVSQPGVIAKGGSRGTGAGNLSLAVRALVPVLPAANRVVALFDHDHEGEPQFNGLTKFDFAPHPSASGCLKAGSRDVFAVLLPAPPGREKLVSALKASFRVLEIEHYYPDAVLQQHGLVEDVFAGGDIFEIKDSKKAHFAKQVAVLPASAFEAFRVLFDRLRVIGLY